MKDQEIRIALKCQVLRRYSKTDDILIVDELGVRHGAARVDLAVINGIIHGYELKSDFDTLARLPHQSLIYNSVFDRMTLVVGKKHLDHAVKIVPDWWGIKVVELGNRGGAFFTSVRRPKNNPQSDLLSFTKLLWREEALTFLEEIGKADGVRSKPRAAVYSRLVEAADRETIHPWVLQCLKSRTSWRSV